MLWHRLALSERCGWDGRSRGCSGGRKADQNDNQEEGAPGRLGGWAGGQVSKWAGELAGLRQRRKEEGWVVEESGVR